MMSPNKNAGKSSQDKNKGKHTKDNFAKYKKENKGHKEVEDRDDVMDRQKREFKAKSSNYRGKSASKDAFSAKPKQNHAPSDSVGTRLNKYIANAGVCSRREADTLIVTGIVSINGKVVTEMGIRVMPGDEVRFNNEKINPEKKVYILLNKPKDFVTTLDDPEGRKTVMDLVASACSERVYPVGRLDRNTTGLLLLTNDGDLTKKLTHPKYNKKKIYHVEVDKPIDAEHLAKIGEGVELEDGFIKADAISYVDNLQNEVGIELHSGRNRIVRRVMEHFGYNVKRLDRVVFAGLTKVNLPRGKWRFLTEKEIIRLQTGMHE